MWGLNYNNGKIVPFAIRASKIQNTMKLGPLEIFLAEFVLYLFLWLSNEYVGTLLSALFGGISLALLIVARISEWIEPSKVPRWYFPARERIAASLNRFQLAGTCGKAHFLRK